ncbi:hypothetical protein ACFL21_05135, partial [Patescibacteria group bacterium]
MLWKSMQPDSTAECVNLDVNPESPPWNPQTENFFVITGEFDRHQGSIEVSVSGNGNIRKVGDTDFT